MGVEEEFLLVDPETGQPLMRNAAVVATAAELGVDLQLELSQCQVETNSPVCTDGRGLRSHLLEARSLAAAAAVRNGCRLVAAGTPLIGPPRMPISDCDRYRRMAQRFGVLAVEQGICGCHIHIDVADRETAIQVCNQMRPWLPSLLALGANSSVHRGMDSGFAGWRSILWSRWPAAGPPPFFASKQDYESTVSMMIDTGLLLDERMIYWDIRPSSHLPTVEVRVVDVQPTVDEAVLVATLVRALVMTAIRSIDRGDRPPDVRFEVLQAATWLAARDGLRGNGIDPFTTRSVPVPRQLEMLLGHVRDSLDELGEYRRVSTMVNQQVEHGNGAIWQRGTFQRRRNAVELVQSAARRTLQG